MTKKKYGWVMIAVTLVLCVVAGTIIRCDVKNEDSNKTENGEIEKIIDSITYVNFSSDNADDCFIPVSFIKNGVQLITGDLGLQGDVLAGAPKADTLKKANGIASDGEWNFFPYEVKHTEYTYDNQPENKEWTDYFRTMLAKDAPIIIADVYSLEQHGVQIDVVTASNIVMTGDIAKLYTKDDTYPTPNVPQSEKTSIYIICAIFIEGQEPTKLYELSESFLTINDMGGISCDPTVYSGYFQQIYSTLQYDESGEVSVCPIYCNMNGELNLRSYSNKPAYVIADIDGDGKVELVEYRDRLSSDMSICIIYDYTNDGYVRQASVKAGPDTPNTPVANNESTTQYTFELTDNSRPNDTPSIFSIVTPSSWGRSSNLDILGEALTFPSGVSERKKRMEVNQYNDLQILLSNDGGGVNNKIVVLDPDVVTSGITENGYKYIYYREGIFNEDTEPYAFYHFYIDPENGRKYKISFITFLDCDTADYFETVILPAVNSVVITPTTAASASLAEMFEDNSDSGDLTQFLNKTFTEIEAEGYTLAHLQGNNGWAGWPNYSISEYEGVTLTFSVSYGEETREHLTNIIPDGVEITNPGITINGLRVSMTGEEAKQAVTSWDDVFFSFENGGRNYVTTYNNNNGYKITAYWAMPEEMYNDLLASLPDDGGDEVYVDAKKKLVEPFKDNPKGEIVGLRIEKAPANEQPLANEEITSPNDTTSTYIHVEAISALPQDPSEAWKIYDPMMSPIYYFFDNGLMYYCRYEYNGEHYEKNTLFLPEGYTNGEIFYVRGTGGSASMYIIVKTDQGYLRYDSSVSHCPDEIYSVTELTEDELEYEKSCMANDQMWVTPDSTEVFDPEAYAELIPGGSTHYEFYHQLMPAPAQTYLYFCSVRTLNSLGTEYTDDPPRDFKVYAKQADDNILYSVEATLPDDLEYDSVLPVLAIHGGGSMECRFFLRLTNGIEVFYISFDNFEWTDDYLSFKYGGIVSDDELSELALQ